MQIKLKENLLKLYVQHGVDYFNYYDGLKFSEEYDNPFDLELMGYLYVDRKGMKFGDPSIYSYKFTQKFIDEVVNGIE